jgi:phosphoribosylanthranilate isomerase
MSNKSKQRTKVKICGITTLADARFVSGALADFLGFIFYPESPRYVEPGKASAIINWLEGPQKVGVFVNQPLDDVNSIAVKTGIDLIQLHGNESPAYCGLMDKPVIKVFHITKEKSTNDVMNEIEAYAEVADYYLFDTKSSGSWGGTGKSFDWNILKHLGIHKPFFLAGGLNPDNVRNAIKAVNPFAVDLSSGLEELPGKKNFDKVEHFFDVISDLWQEQER